MVAAGVLLVGAPAAYADGPDEQDGGQQQCSDQQSTDQQCQLGGNPASQIIEKAQDAANQAQQQLQQQQQQQQLPPDKRPISQVGYMYLVNGVPTCFHNWDVGVGGMVPITPVQPC